MSEDHEDYTEPDWKGEKIESLQSDCRAKDEFIQQLLQESEGKTPIGDIKYYRDQVQTLLKVVATLAEKIETRGY